MDKAIFLDRDGTIIKDDGFIKEIKQVKFYPYTFEALNLAQKYFKLFIITNQPGISKGYITFEEVTTVNNYILERLKKEGISIERIYLCPHSKEDDCPCRKPNPYFVDIASKEFNLNLNESYMIGDHPSDIQLAKNAGIYGIYILTGHGKRHYKEVEKNVIKKINLKKAIEYIISKI
ncbi:MAG: HAD family hydrolase [bacterium]|nr:HAD family hydrolase [bacterium]